MQNAYPTDAIFRSLNREIWIVTAARASQRGGLTATWVTQTSLDPSRPTVAVGVAPNHFTAELIEFSGGFALHLLRGDQTDVAFNFAYGSGRDRDKCEQIATTTAETGSPILDNCLAWMDCRVYACVKTGDRNFYFADVVASQQNGTQTPMCEQAFIASCSDEQKQALKENREHDIEIQRELVEHWRANIPPELQFNALGGSH